MATSLEQLIRDAAAVDVSARSVRAAARLMSLLEQEPQRLPELYTHRTVETWPSPRLVLGVTGAPGTGKSTLTDKLVRALRARRPEHRVGVIAVDPSSPFTGGAVLGDRVRMMRHATDPMVFIRSLATRGHLGGLSLGVRGVLRVMGLIGCDSVIIETVGVGQSEVEIVQVADLVLIILAPGHGDSVQLLKAGLLEIGDLYVVNKADRDGASRLYSALKSTLTLRRQSTSDRGTAPPRDAAAQGVFLVSATEEQGISGLVQHLLDTVEKQHLKWIRQRHERVLNEVEDAVQEEVRRRSTSSARPDDYASVLAGETTVEDLARILMARASAPALEQNDGVEAGDENRVAQDDQES